MLERCRVVVVDGGGDCSYVIDLMYGASDQAPGVKQVLYQSHVFKTTLKLFHIVVHIIIIICCDEVVQQSFLFATATTAAAAADASAAAFLLFWYCFITFVKPKYGQPCAHSQLDE